MSSDGMPVQDLLGGEILKTEIAGACHFYNRVVGERFDLTASQFAAPIQYMDDYRKAELSLAKSVRGRLTARPSKRRA
ncbi:YunG family protein [Rhizobium sp. LEGMi198b]